MAKADKAQKKGSGGKIFFVLMAIICSLIALPSTILLAIGCLPSIVAFFVDRTKLKARAISVAALNLAACSFYLLTLWSHGNELFFALDLVANPMNVIVMYTGAAAGYGIDWFLSGAVSQVLYAKAKSRQQTIQKRQKELIQRWGRVVSGKKQDLEGEGNVADADEDAPEGDTSSGSKRKGEDKAEQTPSKAALLQEMKDTFASEEG